MKALLLCLALWLPLLAHATDFTVSFLDEVALSEATDLHFGPDGFLYVAQRDGTIKILDVIRQDAVDFSVAEAETIATGTEITSMAIAGTADAPVVYASQADGVIAQLTWTDTGWQRIDLIRGLTGKIGDVKVNSDATALYFSFLPTDIQNTPTAGTIVEIDLSVLSELPNSADSNNAPYKVALNADNTLFDHSAVKIYADGLTAPGTLSLVQLQDGSDERIYLLDDDTGCESVNIDETADQTAPALSHLFQATYYGVVSSNVQVDCNFSQPANALRLWFF